MEVTQGVAEDVSRTLQPFLKSATAMDGKMPFYDAHSALLQPLERSVKAACEQQFQY
jgi:hypothetical protein